MWDHCYGVYSYHYHQHLRQKTKLKLANRVKHIFWNNSSNRFCLLMVQEAQIKQSETNDGTE